MLGVNFVLLSDLLDDIILNIYFFKKKLETIIKNQKFPFGWAFFTQKKV
jgi:hypothetical protein